MKTIRKDEVIVRTVSGGSSHEDYAVLSGAHLTIVYLVDTTSDTELTPSVHLNGKGAQTTVIGVIRGRGDAHIRMNTLQHHNAVDTTSNLLVKCVLTDKSVCTYTGSIRVEKKAQKTDAYQRNENLLLSPDSKATSSPVLEILANDVRCTHGAIVKTLEGEEMWYLATRGIKRTAARAMIADGFLKSTMALIGDVALRDTITKRVFGTGGQ